METNKRMEYEPPRAKVVSFIPDGKILKTR
jgi:hypothetical protein